jgi:hypothetical protein
MLEFTGKGSIGFTGLVVDLIKRDIGDKSCQKKDSKRNKTVHEKPLAIVKLKFGHQDYDSLHPWVHYIKH